ncbi:PhoD-like phosphatase N-terminal domain-containing protein [Actinoplanes sp. NPDC051513]|uniref:PhoD-like phosphatase N-terminal domain-containing protein n=1 Tax=Actinoplanes sp. NPDC051513 TaxID=3363908 RepID=UPI0037A63A59
MDAARARGRHARPAFPVEWEISLDDRFTRGRRSGVSLAHPSFGHSVHVDVRGLRPGTVYYYRFRVSGQISSIGRTRTAPAPTAHPRGLRFAFASCLLRAHAAAAIVAAARARHAGLPAAAVRLAGRPGIASVTESAAPVSTLAMGPIYDVHDDQGVFPMQR